MRTTIVLSIIFVFAALSTCNAQTSKTASTSKKNSKQDTTKQLNLLDEQTKIFGQVFSLDGLNNDENPTGGATNYLDMIENMEGSEELKTHLREMYDLYDTSLDPSKKEELKIKISEMLEKAKAKSLSEQ